MEWVKNAARGAFFRACEGVRLAKHSRRRGCEPVLDIEAPEKPGRTARRSKSGPDLRRIMEAYIVVSLFEKANALVQW
jgi:hypothetical protein